MRLTRGQVVKNGQAATARVESIMAEMERTPAAEILRRQTADPEAECISSFSRWSTTGTQEIVVNQREADGEFSVYRYIGPSNAVPAVLKGFAEDHVRRAVVGKRGRETEGDDNQDVEIDEARPRRAAPVARAPAARPTAGASRARKAPAAAPARQEDADDHNDPLVTPSTSGRRPSGVTRSGESSSVLRAPKKPRRVPRPVPDSDDEGEATETESSYAGHGSKSNKKNGGAKTGSLKALVRRSSRLSSVASDVQSVTSRSGRSDDLVSLCGDMHHLQFDTLDTDAEMGRGSVALIVPVASTSRIKVEHSV